MTQPNQTESLDDFAAFLSRAIEESGKYEPCMSLSVHEDGNAVELNLDTSVASYSEGIKGEGSDIGLFRSLDTRKVVGVRLPLYRKNLVVSHTGDIRINCGFRKEDAEDETVPAMNKPNQTNQPRPEQRDESVDARPLVIKFTKEPPTKAGFYLHHLDNRECWDLPEIMRVEYRESHHGMCVWTKGGRRLVSELGGEWCGPCPTREELALAMYVADAMPESAAVSAIPDEAKVTLDEPLRLGDVRRFLSSVEASPEKPTIDLAAATREAVDEVRRVDRVELIKKQDEQTKRLADLGCVSVEECSKFLKKVQLADTTAMREFKSACSAARRGEKRLKDERDEAAAKIAELEQQLAAARDALRKCRVRGLRIKDSGLGACCPICGAAVDDNCSPTCELAAALKGSPADRRVKPETKGGLADATAESWK